MRDHLFEQWHAVAHQGFLGGVGLLSRGQFDDVLGDREIGRFQLLQLIEHAQVFRVIGLRDQLAQLRHAFVNILLAGADQRDIAFLGLRVRQQHQIARGNRAQADGELDFSQRQEFSFVHTGDVFNALIQRCDLP